MRIKDLIVLIFIALIWGVNFVAIKYAVTHENPTMFMAFRFFITSIIFLPWARRLTKIKEWKYVLGASLSLGVLYFFLFSYGMTLVSANLTSIIVQIQVPFTFVIGFILYREKINIKIIIGSLIAFVGMVIAIGLGASAAKLTGIVVIIISVFFWALGNSLLKGVRSVGPNTVNAIMAMITFPFLGAAALFTNINAIPLFFERFTWNISFALLYMIFVSTFTAYALWQIYLKRYGVSRVTPFTLLTPIFAIIVSNIVLSEIISLHLILGCAICLVGVILIQDFKFSFSRKKT